MIHTILIMILSTLFHRQQDYAVYGPNGGIATAILIEIGFLSNEEERNDLISESRKEKTAKAIAEGIVEYLKKTGGKK